MVRADGRARIEVRLPGVGDPLLLATGLSRIGLLEIVDPLGQVLAPGTVVGTSLGGSEERSAAGPVDETVVDGRDVAEAFVIGDGTGRTAAGFRLRDGAADDLLAFTSENVGQPLAILLDKRVVSSPTIQGTIPSEGIVSGLAEEEVEAVAARLASGPLPMPLAVVEYGIVAATAGMPNS